MNNTELELRLQRLERRVNRYRLTLAAVGLGVIGLIGIAADATAPISQEVRTRKLFVVDEKGKEMVRIVHNQTGGALYLMNAEGFPVVRAGAGEKGGKLALADAKGTEFVDLATEETGGQILISDKKGQKTLMKASPTPAPR